MWSNDRRHLKRNIINVRTLYQLSGGSKATRSLLLTENGLTQQVNIQPQTSARSFSIAGPIFSGVTSRTKSPTSIEKTFCAASAANFGANGATEPPPEARRRGQPCGKERGVTTRKFLQIIRCNLRILRTNDPVNERYRVVKTILMMQGFCQQRCSTRCRVSARTLIRPCAWPIACSIKLGSNDIVSPFSDTYFHSLSGRTRTIEHREGLSPIFPINKADLGTITDLVVLVLGVCV